jgi:hypothetical protein
MRVRFMNSDAAIAGRARAVDLAPAWLWLGAGIYVLLLSHGTMLLNDSDTYWQISVGKWILDNGTFPRADVYSFTRAGYPWNSTSWLAQVLYAGAYEFAGWSGPVILAITAIAATFALLARILSRHIPSTYAVVISLAALVLSTSHLLARPHVLVLPIMVLWVNGLVSASDRGRAPSLRMLPLIALWANLHGGFVFGLTLVGPFAIDALWNADRPQRKPLLLRWAVFGVGACLACCATPYGWDSLLASRKILDLGELLHLIYEWMPPDFSQFGPFEACVLASIAGALYCGIRLTPPRILLTLGLLHMALSHVRNVEIFALLMPLVVIGPVAEQLSLRPRPAAIFAPIASVAALVAALGIFTWTFATHAGFSPPVVQSPAAAVDMLSSRNPKRILNDLPFGGYLIWRHLPVFIDGRAELYGESFEMAYYRALQLKDVDGFLDLLKRYDIDAVLLTPATPAANLLDHLDGWKRIYADDNAVVHVRVPD